MILYSNIVKNGDPTDILVNVDKFDPAADVYLWDDRSPKSVCQATTLFIKLVSV